MYRQWVFRVSQAKVVHTTSPMQSETLALGAAIVQQPGPLQEMDFDDYQAVYRQWRDGHMGIEDIVKRFGADVAEFVQSQYAMGPMEDTPHARPTQMVGGDAAPHLAPLDSRERSAMVAPGAPKPTFGFFESMYGQWKHGQRTDGNIAAAFGEQWLDLFRIWRREGLDAIHEHLGDLLDMGHASTSGQVELLRCLPQLYRRRQRLHRRYRSAWCGKYTNGGHRGCYATRPSRRSMDNVGWRPSG